MVFMSFQVQVQVVLLLQLEARFESDVVISG
jgi:hypothetical protein